jgi:hypothetical protein
LRILIDHITPHLPKDNDEVNRYVKRLQAMLDTATVANPVHDQEYEDQVHEDDHRRSPRGDLASSITPPEECSRGMAETTATCAMSSAADMHAIGLKPTLRSGV